MKKSNFITGLVYLMVGISFLILSLLLDTKLDSLFFGFAGAGICVGIVILWKYYFWTRPKNEKKYKERLETEDIELHDERKERLRDRAGRYAYLLNLIVISVSTIVFSVLGSLEIVKNSRLIIIYLAGLLVTQYIAGIIIYKKLTEKY